MIKELRGDYMKYNIGISIRNLREKRGISQKNIYEGLCSQASFSRIELGEKEMDQLLLYACLSRLGISINKYTLILSKKDIELMRQREVIENALIKKKWKEVQVKIEEYENNDFVGVTKKLHLQYLDFIKAKVDYENCELERAKEKLEIGLNRTNKQLLAFIKSGEEKLTYCISEMELIKVCLYCEILEKEKDARVNKIWKRIYHYIENDIEDTEYKMKFYPVCAYHIALLYQKEKNWLGCFSYCERAITFLKQYKRLLFLKEFLELHQLVSKEMGIEEKRENIEYLSMLNFVEENLIDRYRIDKRRHLGVYFIGDVIKNTREYIGLTQEELNFSEQDGKGKAATSTLSYIENGHRTPRKTTSDHYFQQLGLGQYQMEITPILGEKFELQELRWKMDYSLSENRLDQVKILYQQIKNQLDMSVIQNQQYIERIKAIVEYYSNEITIEEYQNKLIKILQMTWKDYDVFDLRKITKFLSKTEISLFINIAQSYKDKQEYEVAIQLYKRLKEYFDNAYMTSAYTSYILLCYSLEQVLGLSSKHKDSIELAKEGIKVEYIHKDIQVLNKHLYNIGWNYGELLLKCENEEEKKYYKKACQLYLEQALKGAIFMNDIEIIRHIEGKRDLFDINIESFYIIR